MTGVAQVNSFVQNVLAEAASMTVGEKGLVVDMVRGISARSSVLLSEIARATTDGSDEELKRAERRMSRELGEEQSGLDALPKAWLKVAAPHASAMPFKTVDGSDLSKPWGGVFEAMGVVRDSSDPKKLKRPGYWTISIEASDGHRQHLPLSLDIFSTKEPAYIERGEQAWTQTQQAALSRVVAVTGRHGVWLFDRGFDDEAWFTYLQQVLMLLFVVRLKKNRHLEVGDRRHPVKKAVGELAKALVKSYRVTLPCVDTRTHTERTYSRAFTYIPVRLPGTTKRMWLLVVKGKKDDWYLLCNEESMTPARAQDLIRAYLIRWGNEEVTRSYKQCTKAEKFRVRKLCAIRRLLFVAMLAVAVQALLLFVSPAAARALMARVQAFVKTVLFPHYRLWDGMVIALRPTG